MTKIWHSFTKCNSFSRITVLRWYVILTLGVLYLAIQRWKSERRRENLWASTVKNGLPHKSGKMIKYKTVWPLRQAKKLDIISDTWTCNNLFCLKPSGKHFTKKLFNIRLASALVKRLRQMAHDREVPGSRTVRVENFFHMFDGCHVMSDLEYTVKSDGRT